VLTNLPTPITFIDYLNLPANKQSPIDELVEQRIIARLIVKNSLNKKLKLHLMTTYSTNKEECYPNTVSDALALLSSFATQGKDTTADEAMVSYHESSPVDLHDDDLLSIHDDDDKEEELSDPVESIHDDDIVITNDINEPDSNNNNRVTFDETVMASIIAEATIEANDDQFIGASFAQLQDVDDVYEDDEPDLVICAHIINSEPIKEEPSIPQAQQYPNPHRDFELIVYHTAHRVNNRNVINGPPPNVFTMHYDPNKTNLISYQYDSPCAESIVDYSDAMRIKLKMAGIHDSTDLMNIFADHTDIESTAIFKQQLNNVDQKGFKTSTVRLFKEETFRHLAHANFNLLRYNQMMVEIGDDVGPETFPKMNVLLHHVVSAFAINQRRHKPNRWVNKVTAKLINCGISEIEQLESMLDTNTLNTCIGQHHMPRLHQITIHGFVGIQSVMSPVDLIE
jgi:hypothetical protein